MTKETKKANKGEQNERVKMIVETFMEIITWTVIIHLIVGPYNNICVELLNSINTNNSELKFAMIVLSFFLIICLTIKLVKYVINSGKKKILFEDSC